MLSFRVWFSGVNLTEPSSPPRTCFNKEQSYILKYGASFDLMVKLKYNLA